MDRQQCTYSQDVNCIQSAVKKYNNVKLKTLQYLTFEGNKLLGCSVKIVDEKLRCLDDHNVFICCSLFPVAFKLSVVVIPSAFNFSEPLASPLALKYNVTG